MWSPTVAPPVVVHSCTPSVLTLEVKCSHTGRSASIWGTVCARVCLFSVLLSFVSTPVLPGLGTGATEDAPGEWSQVSHIYCFKRNH